MINKEIARYINRLLTDREKLVVEITEPADYVGGTGIGTVVNVQVFGDEDQAFA